MSSTPRPNPVDEDFKRIKDLISNLEEKLERANSCSDEEFKAAYAAFTAANDELVAAASSEEICRMIQNDTALIDHAKEMIDQYRRGLPIDGFTLQLSASGVFVQTGLCSSCKGRLEISSMENVATCTTHGCEKHLCVKCYHLFKSVLGIKSEHWGSPHKKRRSETEVDMEEDEGEESDSADENEEEYKCTGCLLGETDKRLGKDDVFKILYLLHKKGVITDDLILEARETSSWFTPNERYREGFKLAALDRMPLEIRRGKTVYRVYAGKE